MRASYYAKAFHELARLRLPAQAGPTSDGQAAARTVEGGVLVKQFVGTVAQNGHAHLFPKIIRSLDRTLRREEKKSTIEITGATELSPEKVSRLLKQEPFKHVLSSEHKKVVRKMDETLVGGVVVRTEALRIDASYKRSLLELYQSLISS